MSVLIHNSPKLTDPNEKLLRKESIQIKSPAVPTASWAKRQTDSEFIEFLFRNTILQLTEDTNNTEKLGADVLLKNIEHIAENSLLYKLLDGASTKKIRLDMEVLHLTILEINTYALKVLSKDPKGEKKLSDIINAVELCVKRLIKNGLWSTEDTKRFYVDLSLLQEQIYPGAEGTPVDLLISKLHSDAYLSDDIQPFIDAIVTESQFIPIEEIFAKKWRNDKEFEEIVKIAVKFITESEKDSYDLMMANTLVGWLKRTGASLLKADLVKGADNFRANTIATKSVFLRALRKKHLKCFETTPDQPISDKKSAKKDSARGEKSEKKEKLIEKSKKIEGEKDVKIDIVEHEIRISGQHYTASFAIQESANQKIVKAITVSKNQPPHDHDDEEESSSASTDQDVYMFVEQVENPEDAPTLSTSIAALPLYKVDLIPNSNSVRLQKAPDELHDAIVKLIPSKEYECTVHTAVMFEKELMLVEIIAQIGVMLSVRGLLGAIKTRMGQLDPGEFDLARLEATLTAAYVHPVNRYLSTFYKNNLFDAAVVPSHIQNKKAEERSMTKLADAVVDAVEAIGTKKKKPPYRWLFRAICATFYEDPDKIASDGLTAVQTSKELRLLECFTLLKKALKENQQDKRENKAENGDQQRVIITCVDTIVSGILNTISSEKKSNEKKSKFLGFLEKEFLDFKDFPSLKIIDVLDETISKEKKAVKIFQLLFKMESLGIYAEATKDQKQMITQFLSPTREKGK